MGSRSHDDENQTSFDRLIKRDRRQARKMLAGIELQVEKTLPEILPQLRNVFTKDQTAKLRKTLVVSGKSVSKTRNEIQSVVTEFRDRALILMTLPDKELGQFLWRFYRTIFSAVTAPKSALKSRRGKKAA